MLQSAFLVKALFSFCRRTTSTNTATNTPSSSSTPAPTSIQRGGVAYEAVPTMEMGAGTTSYVAFDSPRRQVCLQVVGHAHNHPMGSPSKCQPVVRELFGLRVADAMLVLDVCWVVQVYVGVPVSAPPPNTHAVPPQSAPGYAMVL